MDGCVFEILCTGGEWVDVWIDVCVWMCVFDVLFTGG
jgi:hypothetical protein